MRVEMVILTFILPITACNDASKGDEGNRVQSQVNALVEKLERGQIGRIEVPQIPPRILTRTRITPEMLEKQFHYKLTIRDIRGGAYQKGLLEAAKSIEVQPQAEMLDLRWGVIFYGVDDMHVSALYFDRSGKSGAVDNTAASFRGNFFEWLHDNFSNCFR